jgi:hypothetical protein
MNLRAFINCILLFLFCTMSCHKGANPKPGVDVYLCGYTRTGEGNVGNMIATYWKNGTAVSLANSSEWSDAKAITTDGDNIYISGYEIAANGNLVATYWKNGIVVRLADSSINSNTSAIAVQDGNVYVAGSIPTGAVYWKNGTIVNLQSSLAPTLLGMAVSANGDVYLAGYTNPGGINKATYWKNGVPVTLADNGQGSSASAIAVHGSDVYVAGTIYGYIYNIATYWKNGVPTSLTNGVINSSASGIVVNGNDIYIAGSVNVANGYGLFPESYFIYWKNGKAQNNIGEISSAINPGNMAVVDTDVYVVNTGAGYPAYWKDSNYINYSNYSSAPANGIAIVTH